MKQPFIERMDSKYWPGIAGLLIIVAVFWLWVFNVPAPAHANNERIITIYHDGQQQVVATTATTVSAVLARAKVSVGRYDIVEPSLNASLISSNYNINVYRAVPVTIVDGLNRYHVMTPQTSNKDIAQAAGLTVYNEDILTLSRIDNFVGQESIGLLLTIKRATPLKLVLYGNTIDVRTQATTVQDLLREKGIVLHDGDNLWPAPTTTITAQMVVAVYRNGSQTVKQVSEAFPIRHIYDANQPIGYSHVQQTGVNGQRLVISGNDGVLQSIEVSQPQEETEIVGIKALGFSGDFAAALAKLRSCESGGNYSRIQASGGHFGAYQFDITTWQGAAPAAFTSVRPDQAPPSVQDQAATNLYKRRGWQPWTCATMLGLQDIYR